MHRMKPSAFGRRSGRYCGRCVLPGGLTRFQRCTHYDIANYCFPKNWPSDREQRARVIGEWLQTEARFLVS